MKPDIEQVLREMKIPFNRDASISKLENVMPINKRKGLQLNIDNSFYVKQAMVQLTTSRGLRAAHIFLLEHDQFEWNLFYPKDEPLTKAEVNGHLMFAIEYMKHPNTSPNQQVEKSGKALIHDANSIIEYLDEIHHSVPISIVLVFDNHIFITANFLSETMLCKSILNYVEPDIIHNDVNRWPDSDRRSRMLWYAKQKKRIDHASFLISTNKGVIRNVK